MLILTVQLKLYYVQVEQAIKCISVASLMQKHVKVVIVNNYEING